MNYNGHLYGKTVAGYFKTGKTSKDWDQMEARIKELEDENKLLLNRLGVHLPKCPLCGGETTYLEPDKCMNPECPNCIF